MAKVPQLCVVGGVWTRGSGLGLVHGAAPPGTATSPFQPLLDTAGLGNRNPIGSLLG